MMKRLFSLFAFIVVGALCAFAQESFPVVLEREMKSEILGTAKKYCIYLPAGYGDESRSSPCCIFCMVLRIRIQHGATRVMFRL